MGGNSTKATSGINGAGTNAQKELNIPDSAKIFFDDTKKSVCVLVSHFYYLTPCIGPRTCS
jgi:succinate dehydrogenase/fumarate reductase flavoprotein subunit